MDNPTAPEHFIELRKRVEQGDGESAMAMYLGLITCDAAYSTVVELNKAIEKLRQHHVLQTADMAVGAIVANDSDIDTLEDLYLSRPFETCRSISEEDKHNKLAWLKKSSDMGYTPAALNYGVQRYNEADGFSYLERAWLDGEIFALDWLSRVYEEGIPAANIASDKVAAHAYLRLYAALIDASSGARFTNSIRARLAHQRASMPQHEIVAAETMAAVILSGNARCCYSSGKAVPHD